MLGLPAMLTGLSKYITPGAQTISPGALAIMQQLAWKLSRDGTNIYAFISIINYRINEKTIEFYEVDMST